MARVRKSIIDTTPNVRFIADIIRDHLHHRFNDDGDYDRVEYSIMLYVLLFAAGDVNRALINSLSVGIHAEIKKYGATLWDVYDMLSNIVYDSRFEEVRDEIHPNVKSLVGSSIITNCRLSTGFRKLNLEFSDGSINFQH